jgi:transposase
MTDAEWALLAPLLARNGAGRPPTDLRRRRDAIFWVACSRLPWRALPAGLGRADTAHRTLRRAARTRLFGRLMLLVSDYPGIGGWEALRWRIARAIRRVSKLIGMGHLMMAKLLGLADALPCRPDQLPRPDLSETILRWAPLVRIPALHRIVLPHLRMLHRLRAGEWRAWRLTA